MSDCESKCDCGNPSVAYYGPHDPDCHSLDLCDEGRYCDKNRAEAEADHAYLKGTPSPEQYRQDMIDAGRGHLLPDVLADRIDMARMRMKDELYDIAVISDERRNK